MGEFTDKDGDKDLEKKMETKISKEKTENYNIAISEIF